MNSHILPRSLIVFVFGMLPAHFLSAQGFANLDFELATVANLPPGETEWVTAANGLPNWTVSFGTNQQISVTHNSMTVGALNVSILGPTLSPSGFIIQGSYTAILQPGVADQTVVAASISQVGLVPSGTQSLFFSTGFARLTSEDLLVSLAGQPLTLFLINQNGENALYAADVSAFAGTTVDLSFSAMPARYPLFGGFTIDSIYFSSQAVPEPSGLSLVGLGLLAVGWHWRCKGQS